MQFTFTHCSSELLIDMGLLIFGLKQMHNIYINGVESAQIKYFLCVA